MGLLWKILAIILIVILVWAFLPTSVLGEAQYDVEVSATVSHGTFTTLPQTFTISNVRHENVGVSSNFNWGTLFGIGTYMGSFEFCIDDNCQWNDEEFSSFTFGESKTSTETITNVPTGTHTLKVNFYTDKTLRDSYTETITI